MSDQNQATTKPCAVPGCTNPRLVSKKGREYPRCAEHLREAQAAYDAKRVKSHADEPTSKTCCVEGCDKPIHISAGGKEHLRCIEHMREYWRNSNYGIRPTNQKHGVRIDDDHKRCKVCKQPKPNTPEYFAPNGRGLSTTCIECAATQPAPQPRQLSAAQKHVGMDSDPEKRVKSKQPIRLCIVDHKDDVMLFIEGVVTLRTKTHADKLLPGGFDLLLDKHTEDGYEVYQRGSLLPGIGSRYDWSD